MEIILSPYIFAAAGAWVVAQGLKWVFASIRGKQLGSLRQLYLSGSMPSAHSATVVALLIVVAFREGTGSAAFGIALLFAAVVMYDAVMVRRSSGEQGIALRDLYRDLDRKPEHPFRIAKGHTPLEVVGGIAVGVVVGLVVYFVTAG